MSIMSFFFERAKFAVGLAILSSIILTGCTSLAEKQPEKQGSAGSASSNSERKVVTLAYDCGQGFQFIASIERDSKGTNAWLFLPGETVHLPLVVSTSGAKFSNSNTEKRSTEYRTSAGGNTLIITLEGKRCDDTMTDDDPYPTTVTILFDGRHYMGCGMPLH